MKKALSIKQPWATLIVLGSMPVENRSWPTEHRGRIYVHASQKFDSEGWDWILQNSPELGLSVLQVLAISAPKFAPRGAIIGEVDLVDCVTEHASPYFAGPYGFVLANPLRYSKSIPYKGKLRFFRPAFDSQKIMSREILRVGVR